MRIQRLVTYSITEMRKIKTGWMEPVKFVKSETIPLFKPLAKWVLEMQAHYDEAKKRDFNPVSLLDGPVILYTKIVFGEIYTQEVD